MCEITAFAADLAGGHLVATLRNTDPEIYELIQKELNRQQSGLELIASENFVSEAVLEAQGSVLTNKYAEGLPGKRYYGGCEFVDGAERLAIERVKQLFNAPHANVQPHSGAQANMAVFFAMLSPGDTILGMALDQGGHLTHGSPVAFSGKWFKATHYGVDAASGRIDYEAVAKVARQEKPKMIICGASLFPGIQGGPLMHVIAAKAVAFHEALQPEFKTYQKSIVDNAKQLAETLIEHGLAIVSGGTDNHLMTVDLRPINMTGKKASDLLETVGITTNKNAIPNDPQKPNITSGIRIGTPAVTTRGLQVGDMKIVGEVIADKLKNPEDLTVHDRVVKKVAELCKKYPLYADRLVTAK
jgi:glycine hydroxymethyltransferase